MAGNTEFFIKQEVQDRLLEVCKKQLWANSQSSLDGFSHREALEVIDKEYYRDNIYTEDKVKAAIANRQGDKKKLQDIVIPIAESQLETRLAYLTSVFLTGVPIFGATADAENIDGAKQFQAKLAADQEYGGWRRELMLGLHDCLKYFGVIEVSWCSESTPAFETSVDNKGNVQRVKNVIWNGNKIKRKSPYNVFWDRRVPITEIPQRGEYAGFVDMDTRITLKKYIEEKQLKMNVGKAYGADFNNVASANQKLFYIPDFIWNSLDSINTMGKTPLGVIDDFSTFEVGGGNGKQPRIYKNIYYRVTRYIRLVPRDHGLNVPNDNQVQIWKIVTVNDQVIIEAERQSNIHDLIPLIFFQPEEDGLSFNNRSFVQKQIPMQDVGSSLLNGTLQALRRAVSDRLIYDPSRINESNIKSDSPSARIPVRPTGYGGKLADMVYKIPYEDHVTPPFMQTAKEIMQFANLISGQNQAQQGQFVKGNKTQAEFEDVQNKSSGRQKKSAFILEAQLFAPVKHILKCNVLQYQGAETVYNYVEEAPNNPPVKIDPVVLRNSIFAYKVVDGLTPEDKVVNNDILQVAMQVIGSSPYLQSFFNLGGMFAYWMKTKNCDINPFVVNPAQQQQNLNQMVGAGVTPGPPQPQLPAGVA